MERRLKNTLERSSLPLPLSFQERESLMEDGLNVYLEMMVGEYLSVDQIDDFVTIMTNFRTRNEKVEFSDDLCFEISKESVIRNRHLPHKTLRKDELAILFYNLAPYALVSRSCMAKIAKGCFPNFFASIPTINSTFTKYQLRQETRKGREVSLTISNFSEHSTADVETYLLELALNKMDDDVDEIE